MTDIDVDEYKQQTNKLKVVNRTPTIANEQIEKLLPKMIDAALKKETNNDHKLIGNVKIETGRNEVSEYIDFKAEAFKIPMIIRIRINEQLRVKIPMKGPRDKMCKKIAMSLLDKYKHITENLDDYKKELAKEKAKLKKKPAVKPKSKPKVKKAPIEKTKEKNEPVPIKATDWNF